VKASLCCVFVPKQLIATRQKHEQSTELEENMRKTGLESKFDPAGNKLKPVKVEIIFLAIFLKIQDFPTKLSKVAQKARIPGFVALVKASPCCVVEH
jgi:hypothetical protein